jgi:hypothetical protein
MDFIYADADNIPSELIQMELREFVRLGLRKYLRGLRDSSNRMINWLHSREADWSNTEHEEGDDTLEELIDLRKETQLLLVSYEQGMLSPETWLALNDPIPEGMQYWNSRYLREGDYTSKNYSAACLFISMCCSTIFEIAGLWEDGRSEFGIYRNGQPTLRQRHILRAYIKKNIYNYTCPKNVEDMYTTMGRIWEDFKVSEYYQLQRLVGIPTVQPQLQTTEARGRLIQCITNSVIRSVGDRWDRC